MDGVTVGHPRCNVNHCIKSLASPRHRFCPDHQTQEGLCAIRSCKNPISDDCLTCSIPEHREYEQHRRQQGKAFFRLKARLDAISAATAMRNLGSDDAVLEMLEDEAVSAEVVGCTVG